MFTTRNLTISDGNRFAVTNTISDGTPSLIDGQKNSSHLLSLLAMNILAIANNDISDGISDG